ncbi:hypothetical protein PBI_JACE_75 [Gordonia phage Jace]|uniref:Uncharacterized protein n=1 Tax=Gordonia phage Jace TaxID=2182360 RepID=A0A2U8UJ40_9CAUD|nr:hypothetical protein HOT28_gp75 [Gordonia phage Jace]AWN03695.1 hypothetical protein PBI_JACE_75 [Gordonia phage Jace]
MSATRGDAILVVMQAMRAHRAETGTPHDESAAFDEGHAVIERLTDAGLLNLAGAK